MNIQKTYKLRFLIILLSVLFVTVSSLHAQKMSEIKNFTYILQADSFVKNREKAVTELAETKRDLLILDYSYSGYDEDRWKRNEILEIKNSRKGRKIISYISIGEAEDYRYYWDKKAAYLEKENPEWEGNYKVFFWNREWQKIILDYIEIIINQGFDGIYLDIVDAYQYFEYDRKTGEWIKDRINPETGNSYRKDMIEWVTVISEFCRKKSKDFIIVPQNGSELLNYPEYTGVIDAIGIEDLYTDGNRKQDTEHTEKIQKNLDNLKGKNKPVFVTEYASRKKYTDYAAEKNKENSFILLFTGRALDKAGSNTRN